MRKLLLTLLFPLVGCAHTATPPSTYSGVVVSSEAVYANQGVYTSLTTCADEQVPIYKSNNYKKVSLLESVMGGLLGNIIAPGSTQVALKSIDGITGREIGYSELDQYEIVGYKVVNQCKVEYVHSSVQGISYYSITVDVDKKLINFKSNKSHPVGQHVTIDQSNKSK